MGLLKRIINIRLDINPMNLKEFHDGRFRLCPVCHNPITCFHTEEKPGHVDLTYLCKALIRVNEETGEFTFSEFHPCPNVVQVAITQRGIANLATKAYMREKKKFSYPEMVFGLITGMWIQFVLWVGLGQILEWYFNG